MVTSLDALLVVAIRRERASVQLYEELTRLVSAPEVQSLCRALAAQERGHQAKIEAIRSTGKISSENFAVANVGISEPLERPEPHPDLNVKDALILAMKLEQEARDMYQVMAAHAKEPDLKHLLEFLINEEASHKLELEKCYASLFQGA